MIFEGSRYAKGKLYYDEEQGINYIAPNATSIDSHAEDYVYTYTSSDRLDLLAERFYGDANKMYLILYANPHINSGFDLSDGDLLVIPNPNRSDLP